MLNISTDINKLTRESVTDPSFPMHHLTGCVRMQSKLRVMSHLNSVRIIGKPFVPCRIITPTMKMNQSSTCAICMTLWTSTFISKAD